MKDKKRLLSLDVGSDQGSSEALHHLRERVKELNLLHQTARLLLDDNPDIDFRFNRLLDMIPSAFQYPGITAARIQYAGMTYSTRNFNDSPHKLLNEVKVYNEEKLTIEVVYLDDRPEADEGPFLKEERTLLHSLSEMLKLSLEGKSAQTALERTKNMYRSLVEDARDVIFSISAEGNLASLNPAFESITGWSIHEWLGRPFPEILHPEDRDRAWSLFKRVLQGHSIDPFVMRLAGEDGGYRILEFTATPHHEGSSVTGALGVGRDITERRQLEDNLRQAQKMESIGQLAAGIAHDFNNILTVNQVNLSMIQDRKDLPWDVSQCISEIALATDRAAKLTRQLLVFSRKQELRPERIDLNKVVRDITHLLRRILRENISLSIECDEALPKIKADSGMIEQVIMNLAINARDAMPEGGSLVIRTESASPRSGDVSGTNYACLTVSDSGTGIPDEYIQNIFDPFFTRKGKGDGTGLGLAMVDSIVKQHSGWIDVESEEGKGSSFKVFIPNEVKANADKKTTSESYDSQRLKGDETILIVEDDSELLRLLKLMISRYGYRVFTAESGMEAMDVWREHRGEIDLLFTDILMPEGVDGFELGARLQQEDPELKVLFTSGYSREKTRAMETAGEVPFIQKPYKSVELISAIRFCLDGEP